EAKAASLGIPYCVAVVDAGSHLVAFLRQDGALIGSIDLATDKAATARIFDKTTSDLATLAVGKAALRHSRKQCVKGRHLRRRSTRRVGRNHRRCGWSKCRHG